MSVDRAVGMSRAAKRGAGNARSDIRFSGKSLIRRALSR